MTEPRTEVGISAAESASEDASLRALVVDDSAAIAAACVRALSAQGYGVTVAHDGAAALRALHARTFDVLVSDIRMPGMSGMELVAQARRDGFDLPVVLMTGDPRLETAISAMEHGVLRYLAKPLTPAALTMAVNDVVRLHGLARADKLALDNEALRSLVDELRRAKEAALAGTRAKSEFLSKMSHELLTPMTAVIGMTELALDTELPSETREYLEAVRVAAESMIDLIARVLDVSALDARAVELDATPFSLKSVIDATLAPLRGEGAAKGIGVASKVDPTIPALLCGDAKRFGLIVKSLVDNAIKFSRSGGVELRADLDPSVGNRANVRVRITISDTGIGIRKEDIPRVLEPFAQVDDSSTRPFGGAGIGLTIAAQLVALMDGALAIESVVGVGTTVRFTLSFRRPAVLEEEGFFVHPSGSSA